MNNNSINGFQIYNSFVSGYAQINNDREEINRINVFPVADGDTGNNLVRTIKLIVTRLEPHRSAYRVLERIASLSLDSARGNSGLIFSQFLNGLAISANGQESLTIEEFSEAATKASQMAFEAVENPVEGTILTILNIWSKTLKELSAEIKNIEYIFDNAFNKAKIALLNTKNQLAILKEKDVIDAGAMGFVSFLEGINILQKNGSVPSEIIKKIKSSKVDKNMNIPHSHNLEGEAITYRYCTEVLLKSLNINRLELKNKLRPLGDSMVLTQGVDKLRIHIHTNNPEEIVSLLKNEGKILEQKAEDMIRQKQVINKKQGKIAVLTDSIADIPKEILDKFQVHVINLKLLWGEEEYLDRVTITSEQFYKEQSIRKDFPSSSLPSESELTNIYNYLLENYDGIIALPVGKLLSGTWNVMTKVANKLDPEQSKIYIVNTCLNSVAQGLLVQEVAKKAVSDYSLEELKEFADNIKSKIKIYVSVNTFKYMVKGGRVSPLKGLIATVLNLKPIVSLDSNGKGSIMGKAFSSRGLIKSITKIVSETSKVKGIRNFALVHASDLERATVFANSISEIIKIKPDYITSISSIVGMHSGKGAIAIGIIEA